MSVYNYVTIISAAVLTILVLIQTRGASLGAGLGGGGEVNTVRRGSDKTIFRLTIFTALIFSGSLVIGLLVVS
jgi:preprotein translocase subunit SecG